MKKLSGAAKSSHLKKTVRSVKERMNNGVARDRAIAIEVNKSPFLKWGDVVSASPKQPTGERQ